MEMNKNVTNIQLEDCDLPEDEITLCTVTTLGVVLKWQPRVEDIKEVCLKPPHNYSITAVIYDSCTTHEMYSSSLLHIWANQLWESGFWADGIKIRENNSPRQAFKKV